MKHLMFLFVDHFEPENAEQLAAWVDRYPQTVNRFEDADGRSPRHSWFYDKEDASVLEGLAALCRKGFGEVELHLHHGHDTADGLREKLARRKRVYGEHGALITTDAEPKRTFGFIHGKWCLDNSRGDAFCGVNNELIVLKECGCYADFTFPAWGPMQPARTNAIYYATDDPERPKSYDTGVPVAVGAEPSGDLMIVQLRGRMIGIPAKAARIPGAAWLADRLWLTCGLDAHLPPWPGRVARWVEAGVCVAGRPDWVFVKVHTHGARAANREAYFNRHAESLHTLLRDRYNDGASWRLHYVTAREAYNIIKAAEAGRSGNPGDYRDFLIGPYQNTV